MEKGVDHLNPHVIAFGTYLRSDLLRAAFHFSGVDLVLMAFISIA
jgi:hypothetical protein